jgi:hypothetical protein
MAGSEKQTSALKPLASTPWCLVATGLIFVLANFLSYFALSDFHGIGRVYDGMKRVGWPFLMFEEGGFVWRREFYPKGALGDVACAAFAGTMVVYVVGFLRRHRRGANGN